MLRRTYLNCLTGVLGALGARAQSASSPQGAQPGVAEDGLYNVRAFGARGDGKRFDTDAIQKAIDTCAANGGGTVHLPAGVYLCATLTIRGNVIIHLAAQAQIIATGKVEDYAEHRCLLFARDATHIGLTGQGVIDGRGKGT